MTGSEQTVTMLKGVLVVGGSGTLGVLLAFILEYTPFLKGWLSGLSFEWRRLAVFALCFALPLLAAAGLVALGASPNAPDTWLAALMAGATCVVTSQAAHGFIRKSEPPTA